MPSKSQSAVKLKIWELYAGSRSFGKIAESRGHEVFSVDINAFDGIDLVADIEALEPADFPFRPDLIWASPPCTTYSIAAISHHRNGIFPKTQFAAKSDRLIKHTLNLILRTGAIFYLENPRGMLRKMPFMVPLDRATICYCKYQDTRMKPTDIWSNNLRSLFNPDGWDPRAMCYNGNRKCHHDPSPRGSNGGTQALSGNYQRSKLPPALCLATLLAAERRFEVNI